MVSIAISHPIGEQMVIHLRLKRGANESKERNAKEGAGGGSGSLYAKAATTPRLIIVEHIVHRAGGAQPSLARNRRNGGHGLAREFTVVIGWVRNGKETLAVPYVILNVESMKIWLARCAGRNALSFTKIVAPHVQSTKEHVPSPS